MAVCLDELCLDAVGEKEDPKVKCCGEAVGHKKPVRIVAVADTHNYQFFDLPAGDIFIHAGDATMSGTKKEEDDFRAWLDILTFMYRWVVFTPGNHDFWAERCLRMKGVVFLNNSSVKLEGLKIWGSPYTPTYGPWAFMKPDDELALFWNMIPSDTDIVITHGPPMGILDLTTRNVNAGSLTLLNKIKEIRPKAHIFGHIHEAAGSFTKDTTMFYNVSVVDKQYQKVNGATVIEIE